MTRVPTDRAANPIVPPGFPRRALWLLLVLALILRLGTNLSRVDECFQEGLVRGTLAQALLHDAPIWLSQAPQIPHIRGSVVMSWISVPFFALLGPTTFAVRLSGILFHLAALVTLMLLIHRQFGRRAATLAGALFVFAPPSLAKIAVLSYGDHIESLPFMFLAALLVLTWIDDRSGRRTALAFAAGIVCGLGIAWHAQSRLAITALAVTALMAAPRKILSRECWLGLVPGAIVGLLPHALGDWLTARNGLLVQGEGPAGLLKRGLSGTQASKWLSFWTDDLATSLQYPWRAAAWLTLALAAACTLGLGFVGWRARRRASTAGSRSWLARSGWFVIYPLIFSVVFALSRYIVMDDRSSEIPVRYVLPVIPFLLLPIAVGAARLSQAGRGALATAVFLPALAIGAWGSLSTWDLPIILHEPARRAGQWEHYTKHFLYGTLSDADQEALRELEWSLYGEPNQDALTNLFLIRHADAEAALELIARFETGATWTWPLRYRLPVPGGALHTLRDVAQVPARLASLPDRLRAYSLALSADALGRERVFRKRRSIAVLRAGETPEERRIGLRAFGRGLSMIYPHLQRTFDGRKVLERLTALPADLDRHEIIFGLGFRLGTFLINMQDASVIPLRRLLSHRPHPLLPALARGLGAGYRLRFIDPPSADLDSPAVTRIIALLGPDLEASFRAGLGGSDSAR